MSKKSVWTGRVLSWLAGVFVLTSGMNLALMRSAELREGFVRFAYPESAMTGIGFAAIFASILYLIPRTRAWGAILLTGYLGGAVATHVRIGDPTFVAPAIVGVIVWLGLFLRDQRLRELVSLRR